MTKKTINKIKKYSKEPVLVIMAAGMGSRYGGLKQIDKITDAGEIILDFSLYDAMMAGFKKAIFIIKEEMREAFDELVADRAGKYIEIEYAFQRLDDLPTGYKVPVEREKPWGTGHAIMTAREIVKGPFAVINADDYYGPGAFQTIYDFLVGTGNKKGSFAMVSYMLKNTITENGHVARGICEVDENGFLADIVERTKIMRRGDNIAYTEDENEWIPLDENKQVSMNFWGYTSEMMQELEARFPKFLDEALRENPKSAEYLIPKVTDELIKEGKATCKVLKSHDKWHGVTYKQDKGNVKNALQSLKDKGLYPEVLWK